MPNHPGPPFHTHLQDLVVNDPRKCLDGCSVSQASIDSSQYFGGVGIHHHVAKRGTIIGARGSLGVKICNPLAPRLREHGPDDANHV